MFRLGELTQTTTQAHLVYWMLNDYRIYYAKRRRTKTLDPLKLAMVERIAIGHPREKICRELYITLGGYDRRIRDARYKVGAKSTAHLVQICWTEDWII